MAFQINQFRSSFYDYEPAAPTNYEVSVMRQPIAFTSQSSPNSTDGVSGLQVMPEVAVSAGDDTERLLVYRCESCSMPSRDLIASNRITYGAPKKVAVGSAFNNVTFSFIVSDDMAEKNYFYKWQSYIQNSQFSLDNQSNLSDIAYYNDYVGNIEIKMFSKAGTQKYAVLLKEAYPISVQEVPLGWNNTNDYIRVNVVMAYRYFVELEREIPSEQRSLTVPKEQPNLNKNAVTKTKPKFKFFK